MSAISAFLLVLLCVACDDSGSTAVEECGNAGLTLPEGFCARVFADEVGAARHIGVAANGDVYVALEDPRMASAGTTKLNGHGGLLVLRDTNNDGRADLSKLHGGNSMSGLVLRGDSVWVSSPTKVFRYRLDPASGFGEVREGSIVVDGMPDGGHSSRSLALGDSNVLFVNIGSDSNVCDRQDPCGELNERAAIWRFNAHGDYQTMEQGKRYSTGIRNAVGLAWNQALYSLFATQHGRDGLEQFRDLYGGRDADILPSEEFMRVVEGDDFGWPYCYHDWRLNKKVLSPEYGGDGQKQDRCANTARSLMGFPGHWGPNGLLFYDGAMFPERYRGGAFIAFHGSWNRRRQDGYNVVFVPFKGALPEGDYEIFADGFAGRKKGPSSARHRPVGLAVAPDGSLYITDDQRGRIYNVRYRGNQ